MKARLRSAGRRALVASLALGACLAAPVAAQPRRMTIEDVRSIVRVADPQLSPDGRIVLVLKGRLTIELRDGSVSLGPGELFVVPKGVEHRPVAEEEVHLLLIEQTGTPNTGDARTAAPRRVV